MAKRQDATRVCEGYLRPERGLLSRGGKSVGEGSGEERSREVSRTEGGLVPVRVGGWRTAAVTSLARGCSWMVTACEAWRDESRTKGPIWAFGPDFSFFIP